MTAISSQKHLFTAIRSKKKLVYINFELEKLFRSYLEKEKIGSQLFGS